MDAAGEVGAWPGWARPQLIHVLDGPEMVARTFLATALLCLGCARPDGPQNVRGVYIHSFEVSTFRECGNWFTAWIDRTQTPLSWDKVEGALRAGPRGTTAYLEMTARTRGPGRVWTP